MILRTWIVFGILYVNSQMAFSLTVPFENFTLNPNAILTADYNFTQPLGQFSVMFCYTNDQQSVNTINWQYKGLSYSALLPITLITNNLFEGQFADPIGNITIINNLIVSSIVTCTFAF